MIYSLSVICPEFLPESNTFEIGLEAESAAELASHAHVEMNPVPNLETKRIGQTQGPSVEKINGGDPPAGTLDKGEIPQRNALAFDSATDAAPKVESTGHDSPTLDVGKNEAIPAKSPPKKLKSKFEAFMTNNAVFISLGLMAVALLFSVLPFTIKHPHAPTPQVSQPEDPLSHSLVNGGSGSGVGASQ